MQIVILVVFLCLFLGGKAEAAWNPLSDYFKEYAPPGSSAEFWIMVASDWLPSVVAIATMVALVTAFLMYQTSGDDEMFARKQKRYMGYILFAGVMAFGAVEFVSIYVKTLGGTMPTAGPSPLPNIPKENVPDQGVLAKLYTEVSAFMFNGFTHTVNQLLNGAMNFISLATVDLVENINGVVNMDMVKEGVRITQITASAMAASVMMAEAINMYMLRQSGEPHEPGAFMNRFVLSIGAIWGGFEIIRIGLDFGSIFAKDLIGNSNAAILASTDISAMLLMALATSPMPGGVIANLQGLFTVALLGLLIFAFGIILVLFQTVKRAGDLVSLVLSSSFFSLSFSGFSIISNDLKYHIFVTALQLFMVKLAVVSVLQGFAPSKNPVLGIVWGVGLIFTAIGVPSWLEQRIHGGRSGSNGLGAAAGWIMGKVKF